MPATDNSLLKSKLKLQTALLWTGVFLLSAVPRILGAFLLPNSFGDAYTYSWIIEGMRTKLAAGVFAVKDLFNFWLPLYQFICAVISVFTGHSFYVAKLVSAICGVGICLLVFSMSLRLTKNKVISLLAVALIALNPQHILNSTSSMTDVPHAFFVFASLHFVLGKRWTLAACMAAIAGLIRMESWLFIMLLPAMEFIDRRRVSPLAVVVLLLPPLFLLYLSWEATGDMFAYFKIRNHYIVELVAANPRLGIFSYARVTADAKTLLDSINPAMLFGSVIGAGLIIKRLFSAWPFKRIPEELFAPVAVALYFFAILGFLIFAYVSGNQPDMWHRYGMILFALGAPLLAWTCHNIINGKKHLALVVALLVIPVCIWQAKYQFVDGIGFLKQVEVERTVAAFLKEQYQANPKTRILCEELTIRFLSGIPSENLLDASKAPRDPEQFLSYLKENGVEYVVRMNGDTSALTTIFPAEGEGTHTELFQPLMHVTLEHWYTDIRVYRFNTNQE